MDGGTDHGRRRLLAGLAVGAGAAAASPFAAAVLEPALSPGDPPGQEPAGSGPPWVDVAGERELREGAPPLKAVLRAPVRDGFFTTLVEVGAVWIRRTARGELLALSATCPHLGCGLSSDADGFACPCHDSHFSPDGRALRGPSPRGMDPLPIRVVAGRVLVQALRFAPGAKQPRQL